MTYVTNEKHDSVFLVSVSLYFLEAYLIFLFYKSMEFYISRTTNFKYKCTYFNEIFRKEYTNI